MWGRHLRLPREDAFQDSSCVLGAGRWIAGRQGAAGVSAPVDAVPEEGAPVLVGSKDTGVTHDDEQRLRHEKGSQRETVAFPHRTLDAKAHKW